MDKNIIRTLLNVCRQLGSLDYTYRNFRFSMGPDVMAYIHFVEKYSVDIDLDKSAMDINRIYFNCIYV
jgi:hypothetical protein